MASEPDQHLHFIQVPKIAWTWSPRPVPREGARFTAESAPNFPPRHFHEAAGPDAGITTSVTARLGDGTFVLPKLRKFREPRKGAA